MKFKDIPKRMGGVHAGNELYDGLKAMTMASRKFFDRTKDGPQLSSDRASTALPWRPTSSLSAWGTPRGAPFTFPLGHPGPGEAFHPTGQ